MLISFHFWLFYSSYVCVVPRYGNVGYFLSAC